MKSLILAAWITLFITDSVVFAQSRAFDCGVGKSLSASKGSSIVQSVQTQYGKLKGIKANFSQESYLASLDVSETSEGTTIFAKPGSMRWDYTAPDPQVFLINETVVYLYQPADKQLVIDEFKKVLISDLPVAFLMGIGNLSTDFKLDGACENGDGIVLDLIPSNVQISKDEKKELKELKLLVSPTSFMPIGGKVVDISGNVTAIVLKSIQQDPTLDSKAFEPNFPRGIDVTDRRREKNE